MDTSSIIALGSLLLAIVVLIKDIFKDSKKDTQEDTKVIAVLHSEMQSNTRQLERIENKLNTIEREVGETNKLIISHEERIKTLFKNFENILWRIRRLENHLEIGGEENENAN